MLRRVNRLLRPSLTTVLAAPLTLTLTLTPTQTPTPTPTPTQIPTPGPPHSPPDPPLNIVYVDTQLVVADKPAGLLCVPGRGPDKADCL